MVNDGLKIRMMDETRTPAYVRDSSQSISYCNLLHKSFATLPMEAKRSPMTCSAAARRLMLVS